MQPTSRSVPRLSERLSTLCPRLPILCYPLPDGLTMNCDRCLPSHRHFILLQRTRSGVHRSAFYQPICWIKRQLLNQGCFGLQHPCLPRPTALRTAHTFGTQSEGIKRITIQVCNDGCDWLCNVSDEDG